MDLINFQNGTLVIKAKVTINGVVYDVEPEVYEGQTPLSAEILNEMQELLIEGIYPVGSIYMSTRNTNPATLFGVGTWERWGKGKVPVGVDEDDEDFDEVEETGGEKTHTLTRDELPSFSVAGIYNTTGTGWRFGNGGDPQLYTEGNVGIGSGQAHNNLQPYITCYMWKRVS